MAVVAGWIALLCLALGAAVRADSVVPVVAWSDNARSFGSTNAFVGVPVDAQALLQNPFTSVLSTNGVFVVFVKPELTMAAISQFTDAFAATPSAATSTFQNALEKAKSSIVVPSLRSWSQDASADLAQTLSSQFGSTIKIAASDVDQATDNLFLVKASHTVVVVQMAASTDMPTTDRIMAAVLQHVARLSSRPATVFLTGSAPFVADVPHMLKRRALTDTSEVPAPPTRKPFNVMPQIGESKTYRYLTIPIMMGIFAGLIIVIGLFAGLSGLITAQVNSRFPDPSDKPLIVAGNQ